MSVRWDDVVGEWIAAHAPQASEASRASLRSLFSACRAASHKEAVDEVAGLDVGIAGDLEKILEGRRNKKSLSG